ncbi:hypothetical protein E2562_036709 [Oryza meyeriana var. granulata]|uniref:Uncharacterized protein n=1 Tax=Oryza meyeriana var. granulata TaxID=110450 RepID=A0A6G1CL77_9ORYZ|nr:hypothetical protein E2562_036709 [Oryza meyeriana var. granulata]
MAGDDETAFLPQESNPRHPGPADLQRLSVFVFGTAAGGEGAGDTGAEVAEGTAGLVGLGIEMSTSL